MDAHSGAADLFPLSALPVPDRHTHGGTGLAFPPGPAPGPIRHLRCPAGGRYAAVGRPAAHWAGPCLPPAPGNGHPGRSGLRLYFGRHGRAGSLRRGCRPPALHAGLPGRAVLFTPRSLPQTLCPAAVLPYRRLLRHPLPCHPGQPEMERPGRLRQVVGYGSGFRQPNPSRRRGPAYFPPLLPFAAAGGRRLCPDGLRAEPGTAPVGPVRPVHRHRRLRRWPTAALSTNPPGGSPPSAPLWPAGRAFPPPARGLASCSPMATSFLPAMWSSTGSRLCPTIPPSG